MTAFESQDRRYVLKFFHPRDYIDKKWFRNMRRLRRYSSPRWIVNTYLRKNQRLTRIFQRYQWGFDDLREEAGLIYVHLNNASGLGQTVEVVDADNQCYRLDLDRMPFVLQKKSEIALCYLDRLMEKNQVEEAQRAILQLYALFLTRTLKGYTDRDQTLHNNYGYLEGRPIQIDLGKLKKECALPIATEMERIFTPLVRDLSARYEALTPFLVDLLAKIRPSLTTHRLEERFE